MAQKHYIFASDNRATGKYFHMTIKNMILDWHVCVFLLDDVTTVFQMASVYILA